jgi:hypothetical protein
MADTLIVITGTNVKPGANALPLTPATFGETVTDGQILYFNAPPLGDGLWYKAVKTVSLNGQGNHTFGTMGFCMAGGGVGQRGNVQTFGQVILGTTSPALVAGTRYYLSDTAGSITATLAAGGGTNEAFSLCWADSTTTIMISFQDQGTVA